MSTQEEQIEFLTDVIQQAARSHSWMLETIRQKADETSGVNYSDELKHAIATQELLEAAK